jgi:hypothetical protein
MTHRPLNVGRLQHDDVKGQFEAPVEIIAGNPVNTITCVIRSGIMIFRTRGCRRSHSGSHLMTVGFGTGALCTR